MSPAQRVSYGDQAVIERDALVRLNKHKISPIGRIQDMSPLRLESSGFCPRLHIAVRGISDAFQFQASFAGFFGDFMLAFRWLVRMQTKGPVIVHPQLSLEPRANGRSAGLGYSIGSSLGLLNHCIVSSGQWRRLTFIAGRATAARHSQQKKHSYPTHPNLLGRKAR